MNDLGICSSDMVLFIDDASVAIMVRSPWFSVYGSVAVIQ